MSVFLQIESYRRYYYRLYIKMFIDDRKKRLKM